MPKVFKVKTQTYREASRALRRGLNRKQQRQVSTLARRTIMNTSETLHALHRNENIQLYHNIPHYTVNMLRSVQGLDSNDQESGNPGGIDVRKGDEIYLKNINVRLWLSNKNDRPNCMYRFVLFFYEEGASVNDALVYFTQGNKMLDRLNNKKITVIASKYVKSSGDYTLNSHEHSKMITMNKSWKRGKKIKYLNGGSAPKKQNIALATVCYDSYGTLQTDNIASFAYDIKVSFKDP
jgi:hypothetical protein